MNNYLVEGFNVGLESGRKVSKVISDLLDHELTHLTVPDRFWSIVLAQKDLGKLFWSVVLKIRDHGLWKHLCQNGTASNLGFFGFFRSKSLL